MNNQGEIYTINADGTELTRLTNNPNRGEQFPHFRQY